MKTLVKKFLMLFLVFIICIFIQNQNVLAVSDMKKAFSDAEDFVDGSVESVPGLPTESNIQALSKVISGILMAVGVVVALIMIAIMGINFMIQSVDEKAKIKESMFPYLIGAIVTFGAFGIWKLVIDLFSSTGL